MSIVYELEKKSSLVTCAFSAKSCTRDTDSLHSCTRLRLVQEMACLYHECKVLPRKHSYPNLIPIVMLDYSKNILPLGMVSRFVNPYIPMKNGIGRLKFLSAVTMLHPWGWVVVFLIRGWGGMSLLAGVVEQYSTQLCLFEWTRLHPHFKVCQLSVFMKLRPLRWCLWYPFAVDIRVWNILYNLQLVEQVSKFVEYGGIW